MVTLSQKTWVFKTRVMSFMPNLANRENGETIVQGLATREYTSCCGAKVGISISNECIGFIVSKGCRSGYDAGERNV